ncbi:unnamed protein product [Rotaria sp. Silwood2]|nr:unnamed protein product [Rotaria sp. Silwood2]
MIFLLLQKRIFGSYYWEHIISELRSQAKLASQGAALFNEMLCKRIEQDHQRDEQTLSKITRSLERIQEQQSKLNQLNNKDALILTESSEHFEVIRSGDHYMFEYELEQQDEEEKQDEAIAVQEKILEVLAANDEDENVDDTTAQQPRTSSDTQELTTTSPTSLPVITTTTTTTTDIILPTSTSAESTSVEPKEEKSKKKIKIILTKIYLIIWIIVDYFIDLFYRNSRDYYEVSIKLTQMKSDDKIFQHELMRLETNIDQASIINIDQMAGGDQSNQNAYQQSVSQSINSSKRSRLYRLYDSIFYFSMYRPEFLCYSTMILNLITSGALLSMPLPLSIFLWATLSSRPSEKYWNTVLLYTEVIIVVKYVFQFKYYLWNAEAPDAYRLTAINIIGVDRKGTASSIADLYLLLSLFFHRSILKELGLWKSAQTTPNNLMTLDADHKEQQQQQQQFNNQLETTRIKSNSYFMKPIIKFYGQFKQTLFVRDVYASMFFCDFINMVIVIFFYSQFRERSGENVVQAIQENKVPVAFLVMLLVQFILIIIDRALYLRRNVCGKLFFQLFQVIAVHVWLFFVLPEITRTKFSDNIIAQFWYLFKCIYFGYSSIQIRLGYPQRIAGNFFMKRFNYINQMLYRIYSIIPFLLELRRIMDWIFTNTALGLTSWFQLEDIYADVYLNKCARWTEKKYPTKLGVPRSKLLKYGIAGLLFALLILIILFPLLFFSLSSSFYQSNPPTEVYVEIKLGGYLPIFKMTAQDTDIVSFKSADYNNLRSSIYSSNLGPRVEDTAYAFLRDFNPDDIRCVNLFSRSVDLWETSQSIRDIVVHNLQSNTTVVPVRFSYTITRNPPNRHDSEPITTVVTSENIVEITLDDQQIRTALIEILNETFDSRTTT